MPPKKNTAVRVALIGAAATVIAAFIAFLGVWYANHHQPESAIDFAVEVFDSSSSGGLSDAAVSIRAAATALDGRTDSDGRKIFELPAALAGKVAVVQVAKSGYESRRIETLVPRASDSKAIHLYRAQPELIAAKSIPNAPATQRTVEVHPPVQVTSVETKPITREQTLPPLETITETYRSGPQLSGIGAAFSAPYTVCSPELPAGSKIVNVSYHLEGDRSCGAWSDCTLTERSDTRACFQFRLQGHSEAFPPRAFTSEGFLTITYVRLKGPAA